MAAAEQVDDEALTPEQIAELKKLVDEFREYVPVLRALKALVSIAPPLGTPKVKRPARIALTAEQEAEVNEKLARALKRQELKK